MSFYSTRRIGKKGEGKNKLVYGTYPGSQNPKKKWIKRYFSKTTIPADDLCTPGAVINIGLSSNDFTEGMDAEVVYIHVLTPLIDPSPPMIRVRRTSGGSWTYITDDGVIDESAQTWVGKIEATSQHTISMCVYDNEFREFSRTFEGYCIYLNPHYEE